MHKKFYKSVVKVAFRFFSAIFKLFQLSFGKIFYFL